MNTCLKGKHVRLREVDTGDAAFILSLRLDARLCRFMSGVEDNIERQRAFIRDCGRQDGRRYFIIEDRDGRPVGTIRVVDVVADAFFVGSFIVRPDAGIFSAMESFLLVARYGFEVLGKSAMRGWVVRENRTHIRFLTRIGGLVIGEREGQMLFEGTRERIYRGAWRYRRFLDEGMAAAAQEGGGAGPAAGAGCVEGLGC